MTGPASPPPLLSAIHRATLLAAARRILPPDATEGALADSVATVERQIGAMAPGRARDLARAIGLLGSRAAAMTTVGALRPFAALDAARQSMLLERWGVSRVPVQRTVYQGVRRLLLAAYYARPEAARAIGYLGPFHERGAVFPWEGALPAEAAGERALNVDGPVARGAPPEHHATTDPLVERHPSPARRGQSSPSSGAITLAAAVADGTRLTADMIVVGSGAGGAVAAARLAEAGHDVLVLEEGPYLRGADFTEREAEMTEALYAERGLRATDDLGVAFLQGRSAGGGTTVNWMIMLRTRDWVLEEWAARHGTSGMLPADLRPVFELVDRETHARPVADDAHSPNNRIILDGAHSLGWHSEPAVINARGCVRAGFCGHGCRTGAKQGGLETYVPRALAARARLLADARADRIEVVERGAEVAFPLKRVTVSLLDRATGRTTGTLIADAPVVVLAGGAVGTPVLLQRSGLGGGGVGHFLRLHPTTAVVGLYDRDIYGAGGIPLSAMCDEFIRRDANGYGYWLECPPLHPVLAAAAASGIGEEHATLMREFPRLGSLIALVRDGADRDRSNGAVLARRGGGVSLRYRLGAADARHLAEGIASAARLHLAAGAREAVTLHTRPVRVRTERDLAAIAARSLAPNDVALFSAHVNGTCRLGTDPRTSGVDAETAERHGVRGLFVLDGSILPTALGVNPQETIMALATVFAGRITERL